MEKDRRSAGPDRLVYNHTLAVSAGEKFLKLIIEETGYNGRGAVQEWVKQAKRKNAVGPIEFIAEKAGTSESRILAVASRLTGIPVLDCEQILSPNEAHWVVDGLPMTLLSGTEYGAKTIVVGIPFLETMLDRELLADMYDAIRINFALTTPSGMLKHIQKCYNSGRARNRMLVRSEEDGAPDFSKALSILHAKELLPKDFPPTATRQEIIAALEDERPRRGAPGETEWWALCSDHPAVSLAPIASARELVEIMDPATQKRFGVVPLCEHGGILTIASRRGLQSIMRQEIMGELQKHCKLTLALCPPAVINEIITNNLSNAISTTSIANQIQMEAAPQEEETEIIDIQELAENDEASIIRVVQSILVGAINKRATDIHIASHPDRTWIRYRIDGTMVDAPYQLGPEFWKAVLSRVKIMSSIDIRYSPVPQDGKFPMKVGGVDYDIRVATASTIYGEKAILRVQKKDSEIPTLESLGFQPHEQHLIKNMIDSDHGMMIICGPTGSGKSLGKGTPVIKYDGTIVPVEKVKIGDLLMGPDSKPRLVTNTSSGTRPMYRIEPAKGDAWVCNDVHMMTLKRSGTGMTKDPKLPERRVKNEGIYQAFGIKTINRECPEIVDVPLNEFLKRIPKKKKVDQHWKLFRTGVDFKPQDQTKDIDPDYFYYLGLWLGAGTGTGTDQTNELAATDKEIAGWAQKFSKKLGGRVGVKPPKRGNNLAWDKKFPFIYRTTGGTWKACLRSMLAACKTGGENGLALRGDKTTEKTIPHWAKTGTRKQRQALLAGLLDTGGSLAGKHFDFANKSRSLVDGVAFLSRSLGLWAYPPKEKVTGGETCWRTGISGNTDQIPTLVKRKQAAPRKQKEDALKTGWKATALGEGKYYGFTLDGDGRFLLGDFTVTHNTKTLSATMYMIDRQRWNVITAENPVEIRIPHVEQTPIDGQQMTFGKFVPAALRQDPDYIMIGETRDKETTEEVIRASITGHIVMTTLHTNSAAGTPARLMDMGGEPFLITDSLKVVIAQRLIRKLCTNCCRPARGRPTDDELKEFGVNPSWLDNTEGLLEPVGCSICSGTGYSGRTAIAEGYGMNQEIRRIILKENADTEKIRQEMIKQGGKPLLQGAVELAAARVTSIQEALTVRDVEAK